MNRIVHRTVLFATTVIYIFGDADCFSLIRAAEAAVIVASLPRPYPPLLDEEREALPNNRD
jgi:hypothetical protein